jgi:hypothetical protein
MSTKYKITKERLAQIIKEEYESVQQELAEKKKKKKSFPDLTGDGEVTQKDILKARGVDLDDEEEEETQQENINVDILRQLIHAELNKL